MAKTNTGGRKRIPGNVVLWCGACFFVGAIVILVVRRCAEPLWGFWGIQSGGDQLVFAVHISKGINYFTRGESYPVLFPQTPGLFPLLIAPFVKLFGARLLYGNLLGALSLVLTLGAVAWAAISATGSRTAAAVGWLVLLGMPRLAEGYAWNRPDSLCAALMALAIALLVKGQISQGEPNRGWIVLSGFVTCLSGFAKQLALPFAVAVILFFLFRRNWRDFQCYFLGLAVPAVTIVIVAEYLCHGAYLYNVVTMTSGMTTFSAYHWARNAGLYSAATAFWLIVAVWDILHSMSKSTATPDGSSTILPLLRTINIAVLISAFATCWHTGGSINYFLNANVALAVLCATLFPSIVKIQVPFHLHWSLVAALGVLAQAALSQLTPWPTVRENWIHAVQENPHLPLAQALYLATANLPGQVFFDRTTGLAAMQGRDVEVETSALRYYQARGLWNPSVLAGDLRRGRWDYVVALNPHAGDPLVFANDPKLDVAFRAGYRCVASFPLDSVGIALIDPEAQLCYRRRTN